MIAEYNCFISALLPSLGRGWYKYDRPGSIVPRIDNEVTDLILEYCQEMGIQRRQISPQVRNAIVNKQIGVSFSYSVSTGEGNYWYSLSRFYAYKSIKNA